MDPLSDVIALLRPHAAFSEADHGTGEMGCSLLGLWPTRSSPLFWRVGVGLPSTAQNRCSSIMRILCCCLHAGLFSVESAGCRMCPDAADIQRRSAWRSGRRTRLSDAWGTFEIEPVNAPLLLALLPKVIRFARPRRTPFASPASIDLVMEECATNAPGREMILETSGSHGDGVPALGRHR